MNRARPPLSDVVFLAISIAFVGLRLFDVPPWNQSVDAYAYWQPVVGGNPYQAATVGSMGAYLYSPAFKLLFVPLGALPWPVFNALWTTLNLAVLRAVAGRWALALLLFLPVPFEIVSGNVHLLFAGVAAWGLTRPSLWALPLLTKVTPGVGVLWFAVRREWRPLAEAALVTALAVGVSFVLVPAWWGEWLAGPPVRPVGAGRLARLVPARRAVGPAPDRRRDPGLGRLDRAPLDDPDRDGRRDARAVAEQPGRAGGPRPARAGPGARDSTRRTPGRG